MSEIEPGENYSLVRDRLSLTHYDDEGYQRTDRAPTNAEILRLLDALHADVKGEVGSELDERREDVWWNS